LERNDAELIQQSAATILHDQRPDGGWSVLPEGPSDVSASVQAYFALKLAGIDPSGEALACARRTIRQAGGADAADSNTRFYLALLGQVDYECCDVRPPESVFTRRRENDLAVPLSLVWSHRPIKRVSIERGVRELFLKKPQDWLASGTGVRSFWRRAWQVFERWGWTPLRHRALARCESQLLQKIAPARISELNFNELIWHTIALHAIGFGDESAELRCCEVRMREMVAIDDDGDLAFPQLRDSRWSDTGMALQSLLLSGASTANPAVASAIDALLGDDEVGPAGSTYDPCGLLQSVWHVRRAESENENALPPDLDIWWESRTTTKLATGFFESQSDRVQLAIDRVIEHLRISQNRDGGWGLCALKSGTMSDPIGTATATETLCNHEVENVRSFIERALKYLRAAQHADGSWSESDGRQRILATSQAIRALLSADVASNDDAIAAALNWLMVEQRGDGGWCGSSYNAAEADDGRLSLRQKASTTQTAWAVLALVAAGRANASATRRGVHYLLESQNDDGGWTDCERSLRDPISKRWFNNELQAIAWPLRALSAWAMAAESTDLEAANQLSLRLVDAFAEI
jgi:squalene-hopene/tetraprenyl-beta-curcumene cyclase